MDRTRKAAGLDLGLNLSPPRAYREVESPRRSETPPSPYSSLSSQSPPSSCVSMENGEYNGTEDTPMVLVGCQGCLMYVILSAENPKCPKCKSTVLLDFSRNVGRIRKHTVV